MSGNMVALGDVAQFINGAAFKPEDWGDEGLPIIRIQNLTDPSKPYNRTTRLVADKLHVQPGDLLVSWSATLGVFVWDRDGVGLLNQHIFRVVPDESKVSKPYLRLSLEGALAAMQKHLHGATMQHVNRGEFLATPLYLPPLEEQRRIAAILDQAETLRTQRRQALAHLDTLTQSLFLDMFGDPVANQKGWPTRELQEVVKSGAIVTYGIVQAGDEFPGGVPYIRTGDLVNGSIRLTELRHTDPELAVKFSRSRVETNEIVMSIRATVGTTALVPAELDGANLTQGTARIAPGEDMHFYYLLYFLRSDSTQHWIDRQVKGATFREITLGRLRELPVLVPSLALQQTFATRIQAIEALKATHRTALAQLDTLFASLQQRAFAGKL